MLKGLITSLCFCGACLAMSVNTMSRRLVFFCNLTTLRESGCSYPRETFGIHDQCSGFMLLNLPRCSILRRYGARGEIYCIWQYSDNEVSQSTDQPRTWNRLLQHYGHRTCRRVPSIRYCSRLRLLKFKRLCVDFCLPSALSVRLSVTFRYSVETA